MLISCLWRLLPAAHYAGVPATNSVAHAQSSEPTSHFRIYAPYWSTEGSMSATIYVRNVHTTMIWVTPKLILPNRTLTFITRPIIPQSTISYDVAGLLASWGESLSQNGGTSLDFDAPSAGAINAYIQCTDTRQSLNFNFPFMQTHTASLGALDAVALLYRSGSIANVAVQNPTDTAVTVNISFNLPGGLPVTVQRQLAPSASATIQFPLRNSDIGNLSFPTTAGLRVESVVEPRPLIAQGWVADASIGFSLPLTFHGPSQCVCADGSQHLYGTGIPLGVGAMMGMAPTTTSFTPYVALRNRSGAEISLRPKVSWQTSSGQQSSLLPEISLKSGAMQLLNLSQQLSSGIGRTVELNADLNLDLAYTGLPGSLVAEVASLDQLGSFVSPASLICNGKRSANMAFWRTDGDWHSAIMLQNIATEPNNVEVKISYGASVYTMNQSLAPGETTGISINSLQASGVIPASARTGGINIWSQNLNSGLVMNAMVVNPVYKTCGACDLWGYVWGWSLYGPGEYEVGDRVRLNMEVNYSNGYFAQDSVLAYGSSNPSVAGISGDTIICQYAGTASFSAISTNRFPKDAECREEGYLEANGQVKVLPKFDKYPLLPPVCTDGDNNARFGVTVIGADPNDPDIKYEWSYRALSGGGNNPKVTFSSPNSYVTNADCHWYAYPDSECGAGRISTYDILCKVTYDQGRKTKELLNLLQVEAGPEIAGYAPPPSIDGNPSTGQDSVTGKFVVTGQGGLARIPSGVQIWINPASQFFTKVEKHENVHYNQWLTGIMKSYFTVDGLMAEYGKLRENTQSELAVKILVTKFLWVQNETDRWAREIRSQSENEAFAVSDSETPRYYYQRCGRFGE